MSLPKFQSNVQVLSMMQDRWKASLDPLLANPLTQGLLLSNVSLLTGANSVNHLLGRKLIGWFTVGQNGVASIYDAQSQNQTPNLTLDLVSSANVVVNLWVF